MTTNQILPQPPKTGSSRDLYAAAVRWLHLGASLIPVQKNSKFNLAGFGPSKRSISTQEQAKRYFLQDGYNLGLVLPAGWIVLDFDDNELFCRWSESIPAELQVTRTEATPRGWHLFFRAAVPAGLRLISGAEIKRSCVAAPSTVGGRRYVDIGITDVLEITDIKGFLSFLLSKAEIPPERVSVPLQPAPRSGDDLISRIKSAWPVLYVASRLTDVKPSQAGSKRWYLGRCPLHDDRDPSFWIDSQENLWGCFSPECAGHTGDGGPRGHDVIDLVALANNIDNREAIKRLALGVKS